MLRHWFGRGAHRLISLLPALAMVMAGCSMFAHKAAAPPPPLRIVKLDSTVLNLADAGGSSYLRIGVSFGLHSAAPQDPAGDNAIESVASDVVVNLASAQISDVLLTSSGKEDLKRAILAQLQRRMPEAKFTNVYFDEFLVQR
ncbi:MAG: flagellar basal body-associated FliL family protein [Terriglobales bacterium]